MTFRRFVCGVLILCGLALWVGYRPGRHASAADGTPDAEVEATYGDNTEEVALKRWRTNQPRHWRSLMVKR